MPAAMRQALLALALVLACSGCAWVPFAATHDGAAYKTPELAACVDWYTELDAATEQDGVRDAGAARVAGFAHLRLDRFHAALANHVAANQAQAADPASTRALLERLRALDQHARAIELANMAPYRRAALAVRSALEPDPATLLRHTRACGDRLLAADLQNMQRTQALFQRLVVPDDYSSAYRTLGLYGLSRVPFLAGVRRHEAQQRAVFAQDLPPPPGTVRMRLAPPAQPEAGGLPSSRLRQMLAPQAGDPLQIPAPAAETLQTLFDHFAPTFEFTVASTNDRPGAVVWQAAARAGAPAVLEVDTAVPVVYRHTALARYGAHNLLQLVYTLWFPARTPEPGVVFDLLAGKLDGLVWRVTLAPDGSPLVYDSMHPCGCYHMFFPTPAARPKPAPDDTLEWAFSPLALPRPTAGEQLVLRLAAGTHYLERVQVERQAGGERYVWRDYDTLRSLPLVPDGRRSMFGPDGFVAGTDRAESWLFWPMGIKRAGAMRQWGHHATAFVGRRHFDDPHLLEQRFEFDTSGWGP